MPNLRIRREPDLAKLSLLNPGVYSPGPRSLELRVNRLSRMVPAGLSSFGGVMPKVGDAGQPAPPWTVTREMSYDYWRVFTLALVSTASTWLDDPAAQRLLQGRRSIIIVNTDLANPVWVSQSSLPAAAGGGYIAAGGSITLPLSDRAKLFGRSVAASSTISFYQFA